MFFNKDPKDQDEIYFYDILKMPKIKKAFYYVMNIAAQKKCDYNRKCYWITCDKNIDLDNIYDLNELVDDFTSCIITIILREINYSGFENRNEYFKACLSIKLMKNFCEEHNTYFQSFFFNNTT